MIVWIFVYFGVFVCFWFFFFESCILELAWIGFVNKEEGISYVSMTSYY